MISILHYIIMYKPYTHFVNQLNYTKLGISKYLKIEINIKYMFFLNTYYINVL